jgi:simple sugar transport system ATP-binding protein
MEAANRIALERTRALGISRVRDGHQVVGTLSGGERQALVIARAVYFGARVLVLDEPTSALGVREAHTVLHLVNKVRNEGIGVVLITHNSFHAAAIGNRFVVLSHGKVLADFSRGEKTREEIMALMAGGEEAAELEFGLDPLPVDSTST